MERQLVIFHDDCVNRVKDNTLITRDIEPWPVPEGLLMHPAWLPYRTCLDRLPRDHFPTPRELQALLDPRCRTHTDRPISFVPAEQLPARDELLGYEQEIGRTGRVSTRENSVHDLCNALVWATFPRLKASLNFRHLAAPTVTGSGRRGPVRDAITGFDECGAIVLSPDREALSSLARHDWPTLFGPAGGRWPTDLAVVIVGHGTLEMFWSPYKAMTVRCLLLESDLNPADFSAVDRLAAATWQAPGAIDKPSDLCPLPVMGIPGWWPGEVTDDFWADRDVFRPPRAGRPVPPIYSGSG
jgi:hypothetical protein